MKNYSIIVLLSVLTGCAPKVITETVTNEVTVTKEIFENPGEENTIEIRTAVISAYEEVMDIEIDLAIRNKLAEVVIRLVDLEGLRESFPNADGTLLGKFTNDGIWIRNDISASVTKATAIHEYVHALSYIINNSGDDCHIQRALFTCPGSVETKAQDWLDVENTFNSAYTCGVNTCVK